MMWLFRASPITRLVTTAEQFLCDRSFAMMSVLSLKLGWERCSEQSPPFDGTPLQAAGG